MAEEKSYIGFKAAPGIDWGKLTSEFSQGLMQIGARRGQQDAYFDQLQRDNMKAVRETENFQSQNLNTLLSGGISQNVENTYRMNQLVKSGQMNHNAYRNYMNNASDDWTAFAKTAKTLDQTIMTGLERQQPGEDGLPAGSQYEEDLIERRSKLLNLKNKTLYQDPRSGHFFLAELDETGNISDYNNLQNVRSLNKPMNVTDNFFNYNQLIKDRADAIAKYEEAYVSDIESADGKLRKGIYMTESGEVLNPGVPDAISRVQSYIKSNPRLVFNTLAQSDSRYQTYFDSKDSADGDYQEKMMEFVEIENGARALRGQKDMSLEETMKFTKEYDKFLIPNTTDAQGVYQPVISVENNKELDKVVESTFMSNLGYSRVEAKPPKPKPDPDPNAPGPDDEVNYDLYEKLYTAISESDSDALNTYSLDDKIRFEVRPDGDINLYDMTPHPVYKTPRNRGKGVLMNDESKGKTLSDLVPYFYGKSGTSGAVKPQAIYNAERDAFYKANPGKEVLAMGQTEEMPADQMASNEGGNFLQRLAKGILGRGNNQNIS
tara:strand:+ start:441 stop:2081 length:1641 start_codon:yes stop_codon:yes gene_type:complete